VFDEDYAVPSQEIDTPTGKPTKTPLKPPFKRVNNASRTDAPHTTAVKQAHSRIPKSNPPPLLLATKLLKLPVDLVANGEKLPDSPQPLIDNDHLTPQEDKDKRKKQEIDNPKKF
jgi:hypothetical protein